LLSGEAIHTNSIAFALTQSGMESTIYRTRGERANDYTTDTVLRSSNYRQIQTKCCTSYWWNYRIEARKPLFSQRIKRYFYLL